MAKMNTSRKIALTTIFLSMFLMAMSVAIKGVIVPQWRMEFGVNNQTVSWVFTAEIIPFLITSYFGNNILDKFKIKRTILISLTILAVSLLYIPLTTNFLQLLFGMMGVGVGAALIGLTVNLSVGLFKSAKPALLMTLVHFSFGFGAAMIQAVSGRLLSLNYSWRQFYSALGLIGIVITVLVTFADYPKLKVNESKGKRIPNKALLVLLVFILGFYLVGEIGISNWFVNFAVDGYNTTPGYAATFLSLFFIIFTLGRLVGGFILEKMEYLKAVFYAGIIAAIMIFAMLFLGESYLILVSFSGLVQALIYPALILVVAQLSRENSKIMSIFITGGYSIYILINYLIGTLNDKIGVVVAFVVIPIALILCGILAIAARKLFKEERNGY